MPASAAAGMLDVLWIAPTTNTDGSPLMDLESYRVYYGTSGTPCPGSSFFQVLSSTSSPPANYPVTFRLTGLSAGTSYTVAVTALNSSGAESACSDSASGVARIHFGVSPTATVDFDDVNLGGFADRTFTVSNTGGGTVSGAASTSGPFRIVAGSPFSLVGLGASQAVTVRFTPIAVALATSNVTFTADGETISRLVRGTGIPADATPPTVAITSPTSEATYTTSSSLLTLEGTASDDVGVTLVTWENSGGDNGTAVGTTNWTVVGLILQPGANMLTVTAGDAAGNTATARLTVTLTRVTFTDDPLTAQSTDIKALHILELRTAVDSVRAARRLLPFAWTDPVLTPGSTPARAVHVLELRSALDAVYAAAGVPSPAYTEASLEAEVTVIKAVHLNELRAAVRAVE